MRLDTDSTADARRAAHNEHDVAHGEQPREQARLGQLRLARRERRAQQRLRVEHNRAVGAHKHVDAGRAVLRAQPVREATLVKRAVRTGTHKRIGQR